MTSTTVAMMLERWSHASKHIPGGGIRRLRHASTPDVIDQEASVAPGGAASLHARARRLAPDVERAAPRQRVMASRRGLLSPAERHHRWPWADISGEATP